MTLRENVVFPRLVNRDYQGLAQAKGAVINIPKPSSITARSVTPSVTMNSNVDSAPTTVAVTMDRWYEAPFQVSDQDMVETTGSESFIPMQASEAVKALANDIDSFIWGKHTGIYSQSGTAGTAPFATTISVAVSARTLLNSQLAPMTDRRGVLDPSAEGAMLELGSILKFDERGDQGGIINGEIGRKLAIDWYMDQNVSTYTPGTAWVAGWTFEATGTVGETTVTFTNATATGSILVGDVFSYSGQQYVITVVAAVAIAGTAVNALQFYPPLKTAGTTGLAVTIGAVAGTDYTANLVFHRDAFAWVSRPLADTQGLGNAILAMTDPLSGVSLRLELSRQYRQTTYAYDYLGGAKLIRAEYATKILG